MGPDTSNSGAPEETAAYAEAAKAIAFRFLTSENSTHSLRAQPLKFHQKKTRNDHLPVNCL
jgi:hypothetical protein